MGLVENILSNLSWSSFKSLVDDKAMAIQYIDVEGYYFLKAFDSSFSIGCAMLKDGGADQIDFEDNYKAAGNAPLKSEVATRFERDDIRLQICKASAAVVAGAATISFLLPGTPGDPLFLGGGWAQVDFFAFGDAVTDISVIDKDNILGYGAGAVIATYHHPSVPTANKGWFMWPLPQAGGEMEIESMGFYGEIPAGLYIDIVFAVNNTATWVGCDYEIGVLI